MASNEKPFLTGEQEEDGGSDSDSDLGSPSVYVLQPRPVKRTNEENSSGSNKKPKNAAKLWSDEDEVALLNGIISYQDSTARRFNADLKAFYKFVEGNLQAHFSKEQISTKIRRLKKRFFNLSIKGGAPVFSNPHDAHMFTISEKIWADPAALANGNRNHLIGVNKHAQQFELNENAKDNHKSVADKEVEMDEMELEEEGEEEEEGGEEGELELEEEEDEEEEEKEEEEKGELEEVKEKEEEVDFHSKYKFLSASFSYPSMTLPQGGVNFVLEKLGSIGDSKLKELDGKWKQLTIEEIDLSLKKQTLMMEQIRMTL